ncbi:hypothetical protein MNBD_GAMMA21-1985 [hydrothermal vent metagenome]|uniref:Uncharacterized protein n=1 Tax=hydrothermal vent metagenome TaxID=652676 RepID=A0A3B1AMN7_9ZZZZ
MAIILTIGTTTLVANITTARYHSPCSKKYIMPPIIVFEYCKPNAVVIIIGSVLAGIYNIKALINNAHVRVKLLSFQ